MMPSPYPFTVLYDRACPLCRMEMDWLQARNAEGRLVFVDISDPAFDPAPYGATLAAMDAQIHGRTADGRLLVGLDVLRLAYEAVGLARFAQPVVSGPLRPVFDQGYRCFARHRKAISRAAAPLVHGLQALRARRALSRMQGCRDGACQRSE